MDQVTFPESTLTRSPGLTAVQHLAAIAALQHAVGPFDHISISMTWSTDEGWAAAFTTATVGQTTYGQMHRATGDLCTDPCYLHIEALGTFATQWHSPPLFPAA